MRGILLALALLGAASPALADALILIPGYRSHGHDWRIDGVAHGLVAAGWQDGGDLIPAPGGVRADLPPQGGGDRFYTVELPDEAPLPIQEGYLTAYVEFVRRVHPDERLILAGHSAGGVLGRLFMVRHPEVGVDALITIASPHVGSEAAELGNFIGDTPLSWLTPLVGLDTINRSQGLYYDLNRPYPGTLLSWLNFARHPRARYVSIVRPDDDWVAPWSQDMNRVPALAGRSLVISSFGDHGLNPGDGPLLARVVYDLRR